MNFLSNLIGSNFLRKIVCVFFLYRRFCGILDTFFYQSLFLVSRFVPVEVFYLFQKFNTENLSSSNDVLSVLFIKNSNDVTFKNVDQKF